MERSRIGRAQSPSSIPIKAGVSIVDHHSAASQFGLFEQREQQAGRELTGLELADSSGLARYNTYFPQLLS